MLERYWPEADEVNACIKNEAETADVSVLLAVHQPAPLTTRNAGTNIEASASEQDLLDAFLSDDVPGGYLLFPITGPSGVGKSHIIRWLDAQLQRSPKRDRLHIIRIPKSASLRRVVELILEPLEGDPRFENSRSELTRAVAEVDKRKAVVLFRAQIENALASRAEALLLEAREHTDRAAELRPLIGHAQMLPKLFGDAALKDHYDETVLARVLARALRGRGDGAEGDETQSQFFAVDLLLPDAIDLNEAALTVKTYYLTQLAVQDVRRRQAAADLLNTIVDTAIGNVFQLEQSTGGITLQDIILGIREILLKDSMDLVLLVEDFAALSGIQDVLLKVCVQEGTHDGKKVRATMRTALALTDGYLASRDTILTRAQRVWVIGQREQSDDEIKSAVIEMVGGYLNAARWGEDGLRKRFDRRGADDGLTGWLPVWQDERQSDEEAESLNAFGFSARGHALFPFNRLAIAQLVQLHLAEANRLVFNPRRVINEILRRPLLMRGTFVSGNFPPPDFHGLRPNVYLAGLVRQASQPEPVKRRLASALAVWAGNAADQAQLAHVPPTIFSAFSLPTPAELANVAFVPEQKPVPPPGGPTRREDAPPAPPPSPPVAEEDPRVANWSKKLDAWASGTELVQADARELRSALAAMLKGAINWPALRIPDQEIKATWLSIAGARNNPVAGRILIVCDHYEDEDGTLREGFLGALRFSFNGHRWDYPQADIDYVASAAIIDRLVAQLTPMLIVEANAQAAAIGRALLNQSRIIGLSPPVRPAGAEPLLRGLFSPPPQIETQAFEEGWDQVRAQATASVNGRSTRAALQELLLDRIASFQGSGSKPFAVDSARLLDVLAGDPPTRIPDGLPDEARTFIPTMSDARIWGRLQAVIAKLRAFRAEIADFDESLDKSAFVDALREIIPLLQKTNCWPANVTIKLSEFEIRRTEFQTSRFVDLVEKTATIVDEADREQIPKLLNALGSLDLGLIQRTVSFLTMANEIVSQAEPRVTQQEAVRGQSDPNALAAEITSLLESVSGTPQEAAEAAV